MRFTASKVPEYFLKILPYGKVTLTYVVFSLVIGYAIGFVLLKMHYSKFRVLRWVNKIYLMIFRCVPSIVLLLLVYYAIPATLEDFGIHIPEFEIIVYVIITFSLSIGAFASEILRAAYESVDKGQYEAAVSVGLTKWQAFRRIVLPQAFPVAIPNIGNEIVFLIKTGSLAYLIGLRDIYGAGLYFNDLDIKAYSLEAFVAMTLIYWPVSVILTRLFKLLERAFSIDRMIIRKEKYRLAKEQSV